MVDHPNAILSGRLSEGYTAGPVFLTSTVTVSGGYERRNARRDAPVWKFDYDAALQDVATVVAMRDFFIGRRGSRYSWLLKDWSDYQLSSETILVATGGETTVQAKKTYDASGNPYSRTIKYLVSGWTVYVDGVADSGATESAGLITLSYALTAGQTVTLTADFYVPVRFQGDYAGMRITSSNLVAGEIPNFGAIEVLE